MRLILQSMKTTIKKTKNPATVFTAIYGCVILTAYLLFVGPGGYTAILQNKYAMFVASTGLYLLALTVVKKGVHIQNQWFDPARIAILLFAGFSALSTILSPFWKETLLGEGRREGLVTLLLYVLIFVGFSTYGFSLKLLAYMSGTSMTIFCLIAFLQLDGRNPLMLYPNGMNYFGAGTDYMWEYLGTIGNVDLVAAVMSLFIPLYLLYVFLQKEDPWRFFLLVPLTLCTVVTAKMGVLAAFCALGGGAVLSIPVLLGNHKREQKASALAIIAVVICLIIGLKLFDAGDGLFHELHEILNGRISGDFGSQRVAIWQQVWEVIRERPIFGSGPDTLSLWGKGFEGYDKSIQAQITTVIDAAHNEYLNIWANEGVLALIAYLAVLVYLAWEWIRNGVKDTRITICGCSILCYCIQAFFGMSSCMTAPYFWMVLGMLSHLVICAKRIPR